MNIVNGKWKFPNLQTEIFANRQTDQMAWISNVALFDGNVLPCQTIDVISGEMDLMVTL